MDNKFDLIEKYLTNEMSVKEQREFEELLLNDPDLMREFVLRKEIDNAVIEDDILNLRDKLGDIINEKPIFSLKIKKPFIYTSVAAVVVLLIMITNINILPDKKKENTELFQSYYSPYPTIMCFRSVVDKTEIEEILYKAFSFYDEGKYEQASSSFSKVLNIDSSNYMSQFYLAICEIEKDNFKNANEYLNDLILKKDHVFLEQAYWYLALTKLKQNNFQDAESILEKVVQENMTRKADAELILKNLN
ncbi:MAG: tetratricopeptide repeat protein [Bacteroidales bacterium]|nr:tetratricopeptide repeat protein [Bacteroidales bacterium]